jgi:UDP-N-acetylglucosamine:LPS N-acetylglucosamine transferase
VTFDKADAKSALADERVVFAHHPTTRNPRNAMLNLALARKVVPNFDLQLVVSTGAGVAVPFFLVAAACRIPTLYLEVYDRIDSPTLTGRMCRPIASAFCVQWPEQRALYPGAELVGPVL